MTPISAFVPFVAAKVAKDMPLANIQHAIRETLVFFLEQTRAAVAELYLDLHCHEDELLVDLPQCRRLVGVEGVYLVPSSQCGPTHGQVRWRPTWEKFPFANNEGENGWSVDDGDGDLTTLWLLPASPKERRVCVRYSWTPKRDATCEVPDWVFERFADAIADGALSYLHSNPADDKASASFSTLTSRALRLAIDTARARHVAAQFGPRKLQASTGSFFRG